jgi:hypothetical protein
MTHYDKLVDSIIDEIYYVWTEVSSWDADGSEFIIKETAQRILEHVEEFQSTRCSVYSQWRATD